MKLTPEQQRQLALIESMPLTMETEVSQEEWDLKTPEEKERIIGKFPCLDLCWWNGDSPNNPFCCSELRRQEFERRRKELAEASGKRGQPRQRKKRKDAADTPTPKKRQRKGSYMVDPTPSPPKMEEIDYGAINELIMQQLRSLPPLSLQEPEVPASHSSCQLVTGVTMPNSPGE